MCAIAIIAVAFAVTHVATAFTDRINWDEFLLFQRAEIAVKHGRIEGGGRPGLGVIALLPFVAECTNPLDAINAARVVWAVVTFVLIAGLFTCLRLALRGSQYASHAAALGTACIVLVPAFLRWSVQVRTDQPAIAFALWGIAAILASYARPRLAGLGGALIGIGYLFSQKAIYVTGLGALLVFMTQFTEDRRIGRHDLVRLAEIGAGVFASQVAYHALVPLFFEPATSISFEGGLSAFAYYRGFLGYRVYSNMLPTLYPLLAALALIVTATLVAYRRRAGSRRRLLMSLAIACAGIAVGWFHAAAFPYFWMTLGLFFGVAIAVGITGAVEVFGNATKAGVVVIWAWLLYWAGPFALELLRETQAPQQNAYAFIQRNLPAGALGFQSDGGLFCRDDPQPFPAFVRQNIRSRFFGPKAEKYIGPFIDEFRARPVSFLITHGLDQFPQQVQAFWQSHYVPYSGAVAIAGFRVDPERTNTLDVIVPGEYRWHGTTNLILGADAISPGVSVTLARGVVSATTTTSGMLTLAVKEPPSGGPQTFHSIMHLGEIVGNRRW